jgi:GxxExxY protein
VQIPDPLTERIIGCAIEVHRHLGPGLPEAPYEEALCIEFRECGLLYVRQIGVPVLYKGHVLGEYRPDLVVADQVVVEVKSVERIIGVHHQQLLSYLRVLRLRTGLLINFNTAVLRDGIKRIAF